MPDIPICFCLMVSTIFSEFLNFLEPDLQVVPLPSSLHSKQVTKKSKYNSLAKVPWFKLLTPTPMINITITELKDPQGMNIFYFER